VPQHSIKLLKKFTVGKQMQTWINPL